MKTYLDISLTTALSLAFLLFAFNPGAADVFEAGGNRLVDLHADITGDNAGNGRVDDDPDDGGWDWEILASETGHSATQSPENLYGVTADGLLASYLKTGEFRFAIGLIDTYLGIEARPEVDGGTDYGFLCRLSDLTGDDSYAELAKERWETKMAIYGGADSLAMVIRDVRHSYGYDGLIPWDIGLYIKDALELQEYFPGEGFLADAVDMADVIYNDITSDSAFFDMYDGTETFYTFGLEGILTSFALTDIYLGLARQAGILLLDTQNEDGGWPVDENYPESDAQATAYIVMAWGALNLPYEVTDLSGQAGSDYLVSIQAENGGWEFIYDSTAYEYPEVDGECLRAISFYPPTDGMSDSGSEIAERHPVRIERPMAMPIARRWLD